jgi:signal transduction histidine kinase
MQAPVAICILKGNDHTVELVNDSYLQLVERQNDIIGKPFFQSLPELKTLGIEELLHGVQESGLPYIGNEVEMHFYRKSKSRQGFFNLFCQPLLEPDKTVTGIIVVVTDVTDQIIARKRMEAQAAMVQDLLMTAPGFICTLVGPDHVYELVNERYQNLFGKRSYKEAVMIALPELVGQGFREILDHVYTSGEAFAGVDIPITLARDEGLVPELRYFNFSYQPIYDEDMKIYSILVFGYEVTEQVVAREKIRVIQQNFERELVEKVDQRTSELSDANESLLQKNQELLKLNLELESFAYVSSHDLQEPLRKIQTFATRILESEEAALSERGKDYFSRIQASASRMQSLIQDLLAYTRVTNTTREFVRTDLNEIVEEVRRDFMESIHKTNATLELRNLGEINVIPFQFYQLISNLVGNALKFSNGETPPHIIITSEIATGDQLQKADSVGRLVGDRVYYHITVSDNGIGFESQYSGKIFEVFQRLHERDKYPRLVSDSIVKKIVENHDGLITAYGELNKGATFDIYIPVSEEQNAQMSIPT